MTSGDVYKDMESALNVRLMDVLACDDVPIFFENQGAPDVLAPPFVVTDFLPALPEIRQPAYGGKTRRAAVYQVTIHVAQGSGKALMYGIIESILSGFVPGEYLHSGDTVVRVTTVNPESGREELGFFAVPVTINCFTER